MTRIAHFLENTYMLEVIFFEIFELKYLSKNYDLLKLLILN